MRLDFKRKIPGNQGEHPWHRGYPGGQIIPGFGEPSRFRAIFSVHAPAMRSTMRSDFAMETSPNFENLKMRPWRDHQWKVENAPASMLSPEELALLHWSASRYFRGKGSIIDAGCFLGGSSFLLGAGLTENARIQFPHPLVHSYDRFVVVEDPDAYLQDLYPEVRAGESFRPVFERAVAPVAGWIAVHEGDITREHWDATKPIEILFIDIAKAVVTLEAVVHLFFPALIPGHSLVIQQDQNFPNWPSIAVCMEHFSDYFEWLDAMPYGSSVYLCTKAIPRELVANFCYEAIPAERRLELMNRALGRPSGQPASLLRLAKATLLDQLGREAEALALLAQVRREGDRDAIPYFPSHFAKYLQLAEWLDFPPAFGEDRLATIADLPREQSLMLFSLVTAMKPRRLLEIGGGMGGASLVLASALRSNGSGKLVSLIPSGGANHGPAEALRNKLQAWVRWREDPAIPDGKYDFVFLAARPDGEFRLSQLEEILPLVEPDAVIAIYGEVGDGTVAELAAHPVLSDAGPLGGSSPCSASCRRQLRLLRAGKLVPAIPPASAELAAENARLQEKVAKLRNRVAALDARCAGLKTKLMPTGTNAMARHGFWARLARSLHKRLGPTRHP